jgi:hypothetical protein
MTKAESALHMIKKEREQNNNNRLFAREINAVYEQHPSDVYAFGIDMFLLGIAKGRRMEKAAQKANKCNDVERQCYIDAVARLLKKADLHKVDLVWTYASHLIKEVPADGKIH